MLLQSSSIGKEIGFIWGLGLSLLMKVSRSWLKCYFSLEVRLEKAPSSARCEN